MSYGIHYRVVYELSYASLAHSACKHGHCTLHFPSTTGRRSYASACDNSMRRMDRDFLRSNFSGSAFVWKNFKDNPVISIFGLPLLAAGAMLLTFQALFKRRDSWSSDMEELERLRAEQGMPGSPRYADYTEGKTSRRYKPSKVRKESVMYPSWCTPDPDFIHKPWVTESVPRPAVGDAYLPARPPPSAYSYHSASRQDEYSGKSSASSQVTCNTEHFSDQVPPAAPSFRAHSRHSATSARPASLRTQDAAAYGSVSSSHRVPPLQHNGVAVPDLVSSPLADRRMSRPPSAATHNPRASSQHTRRCSHTSRRSSRTTVSMGDRSKQKEFDAKKSTMSNAS